MTMKPSDTFANSRGCTKYIDREYVLGYVVAGSDRNGYYVAPIYRGDVHVKTKTRIGEPMLTVVSTYEQGPSLRAPNGHPDAMDDNTLAMIAARTIQMLEQRHRARMYDEAQVKKRKRKAR
jgi:hypothetical protein